MRMATLKYFSALFLITLVLPVMAGDKIAKEFKVKKGQTLELDLKNVKGDIEIVGWDQDLVKLDGDWNGECELEIGENSDGVSLYSPCDRNRNKISLIIKVPRNFKIYLQSHTETLVKDLTGEVELNVGNAAVDIDNITGRAYISSANGKLSISNSTLDGDLINVNGRLIVKSSNISGSVSTVNSFMKLNKADDGIRASTTNGGIEIGEAKNKVSVTATNGNITIGSLDGSIRARTTNGSIIFTTIGDSNTGDHGIDIETLNGDVEVTIPENFSMSFEIYVTEDNGSPKKGRYTIKSDFNLNIEEKERRDSYEVIGSGKIGDGKHRVNISATNGNVIIKKK